MEQRFETFTVLIMKINRNIHKIKMKEMADFNLKTSHVSCLFYLYKAGSLTAKEISTVCDENKAAVSRAIKYLEEHGFIKCDSSAKKRYNAHLSLTEKGVEVAKKVSNKIDSVLEKSSLGVSIEERKIMYKCLSIINENLTKISEEEDV